MAELRTTQNLYAEGYQKTEIARLVRGGDLRRVRRGTYASSDLSARAGVEGVDSIRAAEHRQLILSTLPVCAGDVVISHRSAAVLWGLPVATVPSRVEVTRTTVSSGQDRGCLHLHAANLDPTEVTELDGILLTTRARTVVDLSRCGSLSRSVITGDAALAAGVTREELAACLELARGRPGVARARRACAFFDGRSESGGESVSRVLLVQAGLPLPELQYVIRSMSGAFVARGDFYWEKYRTLGEFDGRQKYGRQSAPGKNAEDVLWAEKNREDEIRDLGHQVVRWTWRDLKELPRLVARVERAFARGRC